MEVIQKLPKCLINQKSKFVCIFYSLDHILILNFATASQPDLPLSYSSISENATKEVSLIGR